MAVTPSNGVLRPSGLPTGDVPWGSHLCQFFRDRDDLLDSLVPYFQAGLEGGEQCIWVTADPVSTADAEAALRRALPDLDERLRSGSIEILDHDDWYLRSGTLSPAYIVGKWLDREREARAAGYAGLRISGNISWVDPADWSNFVLYESEIHHAFESQRIIAICSYPLARLNADGITGVVGSPGTELEFAL